MIPKFTQTQKLQILLQHPWNWFEKGRSTGDWTAVKMRKGDDGERRSRGEVCHRRRRTRGREGKRERHLGGWDLGVGVFGEQSLGFWCSEVCQGRCFVSGDGEKACGGFGPPTLTPSLNILFGCMGFFLGWGGRGRRKKRGRKSERLFE
jgi:hypothetical protein